MVIKIIHTLILLSFSPLMKTYLQWPHQKPTE